MFLDEASGPALLIWSSQVLSVDEYVCVEKCQAHLRSCISSRLNFQPFESPKGFLESSLNSATSASRSGFPASCSRYSRTSWLTLLPIDFAERRALCTRSSSTESVKFINT